MMCSGTDGTVTWAAAAGYLRGQTETLGVLRFRAAASCAVQSVRLFSAETIIGDMIR